MIMKHIDYFYIDYKVYRSFMPKLRTNSITNNLIFEKSFKITHNNKK